MREGLLANFSFAVLPVIFIIIVIYVFKLTVPREREYMRQVMAPEVSRGVITTAELDAISGNRKARKAYRKAGPSRGHAKHVMEASYDLADEIAQADGADTDRVEFARAEVVRLREA